MSLISRLIVTAMIWLKDYIFFDYGLTVVMFTVLIKLLTLPFDIKQRKSMAAMSKVTPEVSKIQKRYEGDPATAQKKVSEYYKKAGVSPYASCLPMVITLVFFTVFLQAMRLWANIETVQLYLEPTIERISQNNWFWINNIWQPDSGFKPVIMVYDEFIKIPFDKLDFMFDANTISTLKNITLEQYTSQMSVVEAQYAAVRNGWFILPILSGVSMLFTSLLTQKFSPQSSAGGSGQASQTEGMNKMMLYTMPVVSVWVCLSSNAAFALYWLASNICTILVTVVLNFGKIKEKFMKREKSE